MKLVTILFVIFTGAPAMAQMDPNSWISNPSSSATPTNNVAPSSSVTSPDDGLDTHRYVKKHKPFLKKDRNPASEDDEQSNEPAAGPGPENDLQNSQVAPLPRLGGDTYEPQAVPQPAANNPRAAPSLGSKVRDMFFGGDPEMIDQYRSFLDAEDIRKNVFEFTLATSYIYDTSLSPYYFRNYLDSAPAAFVGLDLWITPFIGIDTDYRSTLLDTVSDSPTQNVYVSVNHTWFDLGVHFRRFFGMAMNSSSLTVGVRYADYVFSVPLSAQTRMSVHNQAPQLTIDTSIPHGRNFSWTMGLSLEPYVTQTESVGSSDFRSGQGNQTVEFGANLGGEYRMSRQTRAFFKFSLEVYKSQFSGSANGIDPVTGTSPTNVPVTNLFYMFDLGLKLGR